MLFHWTVLMNSFIYFKVRQFSYVAQYICRTYKIWIQIEENLKWGNVYFRRPNEGMDGRTCQTGYFTS